MKKKLFFMFFICFLSNINAHSIVDGIRIFYSRKNIVFKKDDKELNVNLDKIMTGNDNVKYQYINSSFNDGNYYFLFFAKSWWKEIPTAKGEWGMGEIKTVFIVKINRSFDEYEINNQYLSQLVPQEYMMTADMFKKNGTLFYWFLMGNTGKEDNRSDIYKIISIDASKPEKGFIVNEYQSYELIHEYWTNIIGDEINSINNNGEFIFLTRNE